MASVDGIDTIEFSELSAVSRKTVDSHSHATKSTSDDGEFDIYIFTYVDCLQRTTGNNNKNPICKKIDLISYACVLVQQFFFF